MKIILACLLMMLPLPALACMESAEKKEARLVLMDKNKDGFISGIEYGEAGHKDFQGQLLYFDADGDGLLSREEFKKISFTKSRCGG